MTPIPLWLDVDTGHDDAFALLLAAQHPDLHLLGVSTVFGNAPLDHTTYNTRAVLTALSRTDIPVHPGAARPFCREPAAAPDIHGTTGLDGTTCLPSPSPSTLAPNVPAIIAMATTLLAQPPNTAWLVATGSLTNIALLFAVYPQLASHLAGLSIMGGAVGNGFTTAPMGTATITTTSSNGIVTHTQQPQCGNWTPWAEFKIYVDPESARAVLESNEVLRRKTTLVTLDLTHQFLATEAVRKDVLEGRSGQKVQCSTVRKLFAEILAYFAQTYRDVFDFTDGPPVHDLVAVAAVLEPDLFDDCGGERFAVQVVTEGEHGSSSRVRGGPSQCGRTIAEVLPSGADGIRIPRAVKTEEIWTLVEDCLSRVEHAGLR